MDNNEEPLVNITISLPFENERIAEIVYHVLRVDAEPKRSGVNKQFALDKNLVNVKLSGASAKQVKIASDSYFKNISLVLQTIEYTGPPTSEKYNHF